MKVFVSWSRERGRLFAEAVCTLLASTGGDERLEPWMSTRIRHGRPWVIELLGQLAECQACIVCLTADTVSSRWLAFEAGAVLGAGADPEHIVGLSLDLEPGMLKGHALARFETFDRSKDGLDALWRRLHPATDPTWLPSALERFEVACAAIPAPAPSALTVILFVPSGLFIHPIEVVEDTVFDDILAQLLEWHGETQDAAQRAAFCCLDIDAEEWLPMPRRLSLIPQRRLAVMHPDVVREHGGGSATPFSAGAARLHSMRLRESIDVIPKINTAIAVLRRDLRDLLATQSEYLTAHGRYAVSLEELEFLPAPGNHLDLIAGARGFAAAGRNDAIGSVYGVRAGDGAGHYADKPEGEVFLVRLGS